MLNSILLMSVRHPLFKESLGPIGRGGGEEEEEAMQAKLKMRILIDNENQDIQISQEMEEKIEKALLTGLDHLNGQ